MLIWSFGQYVIWSFGQYGQYGHLVILSIWSMWSSGHLVQSVTNISEHSNIRIFWSQIFIRTFVRIKFSYTNILGHSFVSNLFVQIYSAIRSLECKNQTNIQIYSNIRTIFNKNIYSNIRSSKIFHMNIYSDIRSCKFFDSNIFGYLFVSKYSRMSHSDLVVSNIVKSCTTVLFLMNTFHNIK